MSDMYFISAYPMSVFPYYQRFRDFCQLLFAEAVVTVKGVEVSNREDNPIGVILLIDEVVSDQLGDDFFGDAVGIGVIQSFYYCFGK